MPRPAQSAAPAPDDGRPRPGAPSAPSADDREQAVAAALLDLAAAVDRDAGAHAGTLVRYAALLPAHGEPAPEAVVVLAGPPAVTAVSGPRADALRESEELLGEGPGRDCLGGAPAPDVPLSGEGAVRWPRFAAQARQLGIRRVGTLPLVDDASDGAVLGALVLYHRGTDRPSPRLLFLAQALADAAALHLRHRRSQEQVGHLERALRSRVVIEQAKGVLAERFDCSPERAFDELRRYARSHNRNLHDLARSVVSGAEPQTFRALDRAVVGGDRG